MRLKNRRMSLEVSRRQAGSAFKWLVSVFVFENCIKTCPVLASSCSSRIFTKHVTMSLKGIMEMSPAVLSKQSDTVETVS